MTTVIFVRHGESISNLNHTFTGSWDAPLTDLGRQQAERTAEYLKNYPIDVIYSSDLTRAMETAKPTARAHGLTVIPEPGLREICGGEWEKKTWQEIDAEYRETYRVWKEDLWNAHPDGGESVQALSRRVCGTLDRILASNQGKCVALFSHAMPLRVLGMRWYGISGERIREIPWSGNASVSVIEYDEDKPRILQYGYDGHQSETTTLAF